jgi:hypothetical protein
MGVIVQPLLYAFAALGAVDAVRWVASRVGQLAMDGSGLTRKMRRAGMQRFLEQIQDPRWHASYQREVRELADDLAAVVAAAYPETLSGQSRNLLPNTSSYRRKR